MLKTLLRPISWFSVCLLCSFLVLSGSGYGAEALEVAAPGSGGANANTRLVFKSASHCDLLDEDFSDLTGNDWTYQTDGTWYSDGGQLGVREIPTGTWGVAETHFWPSAPFSVDIDANVISAPGINDAVGIYAFTSDDIRFSVDGRSVDGVAALYLPANNMLEFIVWDVNAGEWYTGGYQRLDSPLLSFGMSWKTDRVVFRVNGEETSLSLYGDFHLAPESIDSLWIMGAGTGTDVRFDNLCASSLDNSGGVAVPSAPSGLRYTLNESTFTLSWDAVEGAIGYNLGIGPSSGNYATPPRVLGNTTQFGPLDISNVRAGTYYLAVKSVGTEGESDYSNEIAVTWEPPVTVLPAPENIRYTLNDNIFTLHWDQVPGALGYQFGFGFNAGSYDNLRDLGDSTQFGPLNIANLAAGTYHLATRAYNAAGVGAYSTDLPVTLTGGGTEPSDSIFKIHTNPTDGQLLSTEGVDGTSIHYFGERDATGIPASVDRI
ncbi:fibronectin type III domain-containing protein, partial [Lamprobacter modestohalophilus]|uniref:fibronectin type III domain-containing protein n=1 Tax=Lamprobacter modestohalophilus TaxID=1064514 RepID=UPI002ADEC8A3